jgi:hypothetical protein
MSHQIYEEIDALNWSTLKQMSTSPAFTKYQADHPEEAKDTDSFRLGRAVHCAVLEPARFLDEYIVQPDFGNMRTKAAREARDGWLVGLPKGAEVISGEEFEAATRAATAVHAHQHAMELLRGAKTERIVQWTHPGTGIKCKGRLDAVTDRVVDLKTTRRPTVREILRDAANYDYHGQLAWYHDAAVRAGLIDGHVLPAMIAIHIQKGSSFVDIAVFSTGYAPETLDAGRTLYEDLISQYAGCQSTGWWPGMAPEVVPWELPSWKLEG